LTTTEAQAERCGSCDAELPASLREEAAEAAEAEAADAADTPPKGSPRPKFTPKTVPTVEELLPDLRRAFPDARCRIAGGLAGRCVVVSRSALYGVAVVPRWDGVVVRVTMASFPSIALMACLAVLGLIPAVIYALVVRAAGGAMADEVLRHVASRYQVQV